MAPGAGTRRAVRTLLTVLSLLLPCGARAEEPPPPGPAKAADAADAPAAPPEEPPPPGPAKAADAPDAPAAPPEEPPPPGPAKPADAPAAPAAPPDLAALPSETKPDDTWIDTGHAFIERNLFYVILHLDRFFADERDLDPERSRSFLRWRSAVRGAEDHGQLTVTTGVRATIALPALDQRLRRLRLVLAGATREKVDAPSRPAGTGAPLPAAEDEAIGPGDAGLRYFVWDSVATKLDFGAGALLEWPLGVYSRLRFRWVVPIGRVLLLRWVASGFWRSDLGFGTDAQLELSRPIARWLVVRASAAGMRAEKSHGVEWSAELALLAVLTQRVAIQTAVELNGATNAIAYATDPVTALPRALRAAEVERVRLYTRFRRDFYRRWLFLEVEPEIAWPWDPVRGRYSAWGGTIRVEVQVRGKEREVPPPALQRAHPEGPTEPAPTEGS